MAPVSGTALVANHNGASAVIRDQTSETEIPDSWDRYWERNETVEIKTEARTNIVAWRPAAAEVLSSRFKSRPNVWPTDRRLSQGHEPAQNVNTRRTTSVNTNRATCLNTRRTTSVNTRIAGYELSVYYGTWIPEEPPVWTPEEWRHCVVVCRLTCQSADRLTVIVLKALNRLVSRQKLRRSSDPHDQDLNRKFALGNGPASRPRDQVLETEIKAETRPSRSQDLRLETTSRPLSVFVANHNSIPAIITISL